MFLNVVCINKNPFKMVLSKWAAKKNLLSLNLLSDNVLVPTSRERFR